MASKKKVTAPAATEAQSPAGAAHAAAMVLFGSLVAATKQNGFIFMSPEQIASFDPSYTMPNPAIVDANGNVGTKASDAGMKWFDSMNSGGAVAGPGTTAAPAAAETTIESAFEVFDGTNLKLPEIKRGFGLNSGRPKGSKYPFDKLQPLAFFVVPKSADMEDPAKSLASTVSSASRKYSTIVEGKTHSRSIKNKATGVVEVKQFPDRTYERQFEIRHVDDLSTLGPQFAKLAGTPGAVIRRTK